MKMLPLLMATLVAASPAIAEQCAPRDQVVKLLADRYGETRQGMGMAQNNMVMEVYASPETGTWTITVSDPAGTTCLVASGQGYEALVEELPAKGDPA